MFWEYPLKIQTYDSTTEEWGSITFETKREHIIFCENQFRMPESIEDDLGYNIQNAKAFQIEGLRYAKSVTKPNFAGGTYTRAMKGTHQWKRYWANEKDKVLNGIVVDGIFLPPFYYWYLNFCPIYDDIKKKFRLADVWDGDLWYMQHAMNCILQGKHIGGIKGRQKGYSFKHMSILYWSYCWFEGSINTIGGYQEDLVLKSWRYLEMYRNHINKNTAWRRGPTIPKSLKWDEITMGTDNSAHGLQSALRGVTFKQSPSNDVGGAQTFFNYEEPGVSPTILDTLEFVRPALEKGSETSGIIIACGSVGELEDAEGIKEIFYDPDTNNFLSVKNIWDSNPQHDRCCIFISEAYNMIGTDEESGLSFMDENGNSRVSLSLAWIRKEQEKIKASSKKNDRKQLQLSQKCISPEQAFAQRKQSEFPVELLARQQERIKLKDTNNTWETKPFRCLLEEDDNGKIVVNTKNLPPELEYPINPQQEDKRGGWKIFEPPDPNPEMYTYFAGGDPIEVGITDTSSSVAAMYIYKAPIIVTYEDENKKKKTKIEGDKIVACYVGRFDTADATNKQMWLGQKWYKAFGYIERNKPNYITMMMRNGWADLWLAKESDVPLFKDMNIKNGFLQNNSKYGFHKGDNTEIWKHFKNTAREYFASEFGRLSITKGEIEETIKIYTGIDRIDDYWLLEEFCKYIEVGGKTKGNYDRLVAFMAALFICKIYQQQRFIKRRNDIVQVKEPRRVKENKPISLIGGTINTSRANSFGGKKSLLG